KSRACWYASGEFTRLRALAHCTRISRKYKRIARLRAVSSEISVLSQQVSMEAEPLTEGGGLLPTVEPPTTATGPLVVLPAWPLVRVDPPGTLTPPPAVPPAWGGPPAGSFAPVDPPRTATPPPAVPPGTEGPPAIVVPSTAGCEITKASGAGVD